MKRRICCFLILSLLLSFCGCRSSNIENPISFYYLRKAPSFGSYDSIIAQEIVDGNEFTTIAKVLHFYLRGPEDPTLKTPFPPGTYLLDAKTSGDTLTVTLSDSFATLTGVSLSLACCAIAKTAMDFSGVLSVEIRTNSARLDGEESIVIRHTDLILYDSFDIADSNAD